MQPILMLALKSLIVAGIVLGLLRLLRNRSAAERSWIAHVGLIAVLLLPLAPLALPAWNITPPAYVERFALQSETARSSQEASPAKAVASATATSAAAETGLSKQTAPASPTMDWRPYALAAPAIVLLLLTLLAVLRLVALRSRAEVLVDDKWLNALARAQRRMGFKHGTALLISDELSSPISWGLMRPVILLNSRAAAATHEAEAIIAHELAHVARLDWAKLILARVVTAIFWFNPFVWVLAREAHQLREEAADDAVLAADIADTDYAELLVGVARHECNGLLIGAHGVAPSRNSLSRRVARVLDGQLARGPAPKSFAAGVFVGAAALAAPLAAVTLSPADATEEQTEAYYPGSSEHTDTIVGNAVSNAIQSSLSGTLGPEGIRDLQIELAKREDEGRSGFGPQGALGPQGAAGPRGQVGPQSQPHKDDLELAIEMKAVGATPEYARALASASAGLRNVDPDDLVGLAALGVSPDYVRELASLGYAGLDADDIMEARALGVSAAYIRAMRAAGVPGISIDEAVEMRALGIQPRDVDRFRRQGFADPTPDRLTSWKASGLPDGDEDPDPDG